MSSQIAPSRATVLVAEDHPDMRELMVQMLSRHFSMQTAAENGRELFDAVIDGRPDVVVSDVNMPVLDGTEAMIALRAYGLDVPFVMVSADADNSCSCLAKGAAAFVSKRDLCSDLVPAVRAVLEAKRGVSRSVESCHTERAPPVDERGRPAGSAPEE
jgi:two-component system response regulator PrrA